VLLGLERDKKGQNFVNQTIFRQFRRKKASDFGQERTEKREGDPLSCGHSGRFFPGKWLWAKGGIFGCEQVVKDAESVK
jgi:hypothetical protein